MGLTKAQQTIWEKSRALGAGGQAVRLNDQACAYLVGTIILDLGLGDRFPEVPRTLPPFFNVADLESLLLPDVNPLSLFERLIQVDPNADTYYACVAALHKARLKYESILKTQPIPTLEQVGPRGLLQFGKLSPQALAGFLFWRKWFFDIDNRAGQETGYLFEPVIAYAVGGLPVPAKKSPVKRHRDPGKSRQVDCLLGKMAYEFKIRMTIAASGQGRWREELDYPVDCRTSGYVPVLVVLDSTPNPKLIELAKVFRDNGGEVHSGNEAWQHLDSLAGPTMARFLDKYVRDPIKQLIGESGDVLPELIAKMSDKDISITIDNEVLRIARQPSDPVDEPDELPDDISDGIPG